jgi:DNA invertase Pin-like site-specific DNA recombinase
MDSVAYLRVSSRAQGFATQKAAIDRMASARGDTIAEWFGEKRSGKVLARPELDRLRRLLGWVQYDGSTSTGSTG